LPWRTPREWRNFIPEAMPNRAFDFVVRFHARGWDSTIAARDPVGEYGETRLTRWRESGELRMKPMSGRSVGRENAVKRESSAMRRS
jgi:hypothetical protein